MRKNDSAARWRTARQCGERVAADHGFKTLPVDPMTIARALGIEVLAKPESAEGVSGMLLRHGEYYGIMYATHIPSEGFQRFSIAHELGHYLLDGHLDHVLPPGSDVHTSHAGFSTGNIFELEADHFAAGLLMPSELLRAVIDRTRDGIDAIKSLAELCKTSIPASAIRYVEITDCPAAIILSSDQAVDYCFMSDSLREYRDEGFNWIKKGTDLPTSSETASLNQTPYEIEQGSSREAETELTDWFGGSRSVMGTEQALGLGQYGKTLTVLTFPNLPDEEEIEDEDRLVESLTPRFRR